MSQTEMKRYLVMVGQRGTPFVVEALDSEKAAEKLLDMEPRGVIATWELGNFPRQWAVTEHNTLRAAGRERWWDNL